ncbi:MAG: CHASE domain-containing protein [Acidobacteria bacterium]|nr:CHASE domain-containing protein [Acidobacteriota bacterium]
MRLLLLAAAYYVSGRLGLLLAIPPGYATAIWPASGIALAGLLLGGSRLWPGIVLGSFCINLDVAMSFGPPGGAPLLVPPLVALAIAGGATVQALVGASLVERYVGRPFELVRARDVATFFALGGPASCLISASIGAGVLALVGAIGPDDALRSWWTWWIGDSIGVSIMVPLLFVWLAEPREIWRRRCDSVALPLGCALIATVTLFVWVSRLEDARIRAEWDTDVTQAADAVQANFDATVGIVRSLGDLFVATPHAERADTFSTFARRTLAANPGIQALSWNPRVPDEERAAFERRARTSIYPDFRIVERSRGGTVVPAPRRDDHVVVLHIEPVESNAAARGFDVSSERLRRRALRRACATGQPSATEPIRLVQDTTDQYGILVFSPVYVTGDLPASADERCGLIRGYATGVFRIDEVMRTALGHHVNPNIAITLTDEDMSGGPRSVWSNGPPPWQIPTRGTASSSELADVAHVMVGGRQWSIFFTAAPTYRSAAGSWRPWVALAGGMLFAGLLTAFLLVVTGHAVVIERLGAERAAELSRTNQDLEREIAERQLAEQALEKNEEQLRQSQKIEAVGRLAGGVAHDFNNLLTVISGNCELLAERVESDPEASRELQEVRHAADTAASLTRQLLAFSRKQILAPRVLDLNALVLRLHEMLRRLLEENITITFNLTSRAADVQADPGQLEQVVLNLAINARDAMPKGGTLTIETAVTMLDQDAAVAHPGVPPGRYVVLSLSDTGTGMTPDVKRHLFEPFFTTKPRGRGTGLGLATVYGIVKQSGGDISVYSEVGMGTTFRIYFPAVSPPPEPITVANRSLTQALSGTETVLLVEDESRLRTLAEKVLRSYRYTVLSAADVEEGLRVSAEHPGAIHLLLTDVVMPGGSGRDLAEQVMATRPDVKVVYMSGYTDDAIVHHGVLTAGTAFLQKPFAPVALARKLREVLDA